MAITRCSHGHFYDSAKHSVCPYCGVSAEAIDGKTRRVPEAPPPGSAPAASSHPAPPITPPAAPVASPADSGVTRAVYRDARTGTNPVVGWLVCVEGADRGRDFRLHSEKNFIGRSPSMDVAITGDDGVSREKHASVAFEPKKRSYWLLPGEAAGLVYLNDQLVNSPAELKSRDIVEIGKTKLMFWPLCDEKFHWD